ncbi:hypothetical protein C4Q27_05685 [Pseudomonas sp. SWI36]|nr:hypothetical protein C4Q27_05685 [Pseudomonas sp. SWI36]NVN64159.1 hypothetical protein [Pseudomonas putida]NVN68653.1 hypothetical protein [Pseudomonas putida]
MGWSLMVMRMLVKDLSERAVLERPVVALSTESACHEKPCMMVGLCWMSGKPVWPGKRFFTLIRRLQ